MTQWTEASVREFLEGRNLSTAQIDAAVVRIAALDTQFDNLKCHSCAADTTRKLNPDQDSQNQKELEGSWYVYTCGSCSWTGQRKETDP